MSMWSTQSTFVLCFTLFQRLTVSDCIKKCSNEPAKGCEEGDCKKYICIFKISFEHSLKKEMDINTFVLMSPHRHIWTSRINTV